jgi:hypothetical protein
MSEVLWVLFIGIPAICICVSGLRHEWKRTKEAMKMTCGVCGYKAKYIGVSVHIRHIGEEILDSKVDYLCHDCDNWARGVS